MTKKIDPLIIFLAVLKLVLPFLLINSTYELQRDEYLYFEQGQHLDFGFLENPPLIGLLSWISSLAGGSIITIKFWPALFGALTLLLTTGITKELGGGRFAQFLAALSMLLTAYLRIHILYQPNCLEIFAWCLSIYFLVRYCNSKQDKYLYFIAIAMAFGWWGKYSILFLVIAFLFAVLLSNYRKLYLNKHFWFAFALGILLILPNIIWQWNHNWPLVHHMDELRDTQLKYINKADFIKDQLLMLLPYLPVWIWGLLWLLRHKTYTIIAYIYILFIALLMVGSGKGYYALGAYPMLIAAGGVAIERFSFNKYWFRYGITALVLVLGLPVIPLLLPMYPPMEMAQFNKKYNIEALGLLKWEDQQNHPLQQDYADMIGWKELATKANRAYEQLPDSTRAATVIYCRNYGQAGALKFYGREDFSKKVISDNGTFLLWIPEHLSFQNLLFIGSHMPEKDDVVFQHFKKASTIDSVTNILSRQLGDKIILFEQADSLVSPLANKGLKEMKKNYSRH
jgi:4-amino-4-deoxy-L-arabinose transferase-like glycosyltransferase